MTSLTPLQHQTDLRSAAYVGQEEVPRGSNWGTFVQECLATVGIDFPAPWCMAYVNRCIKEAAHNLTIQGNPTKSQWLVSGSCSTVYAWAKSKNLILPTPEPMCVFLKRSSDPKTPSTYVHTGFVVSINPDGTLNTREGNSNTSGSAEGYAVVDKSGHDARENHGLVFVRIV